MGAANAAAGQPPLASGGGKPATSLAHSRYRAPPHRPHLPFCLLPATAQAWRQELVRLQPLVKLGDEVLLGALALVREFATVCPTQRQLMATSPPHLYTYLAAGEQGQGQLGQVRKLLCIEMATVQCSLLMRRCNDPWRPAALPAATARWPSRRPAAALPLPRPSPTHPHALVMPRQPIRLSSLFDAALWMVAKLSGVRTQIPNRSLISQATHINAQVRAPHSQPAPLLPSCVGMRAACLPKRPPPGPSKQYTKAMRRCVCGCCR